MYSNERYHAIALTLIDNLKIKSKDDIVDELIDLGKQNIFIPVMIEFVKIAKNTSEKGLIQLVMEHIDIAYSPGLRAHILDDFIQAEIETKLKLNTLKTKHAIYILEQKLFMYNQVEKFLRSTATTATTRAIMKILEFRGDD